jgi:hypothetical protein
LYLRSKEQCQSKNRPRAKKSIETDTGAKCVN